MGSESVTRRAFCGGFFRHEFCNFGRVSIVDFIQDHVVSISANETLLEAAKLMRSQCVGDLVVVEDTHHGKLPIGIVTDRDLVVGAIAPGLKNFDEVRVQELMGKGGLETANADADVFSVISQMTRGKIRRLPVVNDLGFLVGIVCYDDVVRYLGEQMTLLSKLAGTQRKWELVMQVDAKAKKVSSRAMGFPGEFVVPKR